MIKEKNTTRHEKVARRCSYAQQPTKNNQAGRGRGRDKRGRTTGKEHRGGCNVIVLDAIELS